MIGHRQLDQGGGIFHIELGQHILPVGIDGSTVEEQSCGDLVIGKPLGDQFQYLFFTFGQYGQLVIRHAFL